MGRVRRKNVPMTLWPNAILAKCLCAICKVGSCLGRVVMGLEKHNEGLLHEFPQNPCMHCKSSRVTSFRKPLQDPYKTRYTPLVAPYCAIPRDYLSDTPLLRAMGFLVSQHGQLGAIPPPPFLGVSPLESMRSGGAIPLKGVSQRYLRDTL